MGSNVPTVSDAELDVLKLLWQRGASTVRQVEAQLRRRKRRWAYNTVLTLLSRLREKGYVASDKPGDKSGEAGAAHVFCAGGLRERMIWDGFNQLADRMFDWTASPLRPALWPRER